MHPYKIMIRLDLVDLDDLDDLDDPRWILVDDLWAWVIRVDDLWTWMICDAWALQQDNVFRGDMATNAGILLACFYQMSPAFNTSVGECQGLFAGFAGFAYCTGTASKKCT